MRIFTIGYEGATQDQVVAALRKAGVEVLADVRAVPLSRRPGFSKNVLAAGLKNAGIGYVCLKALGTPPEGRKAARRGDMVRLAQIYSLQLETLEAGVQAAQLSEMVEGQPIALVCFERDPATCHRSLLADTLFPGAKRITSLWMAIDMGRPSWTKHNELNERDYQLSNDPKGGFPRRRLGEGHELKMSESRLAAADGQLWKGREIEPCQSF